MCIRKCLFIDDASLSLSASKRKKLIDSTGVCINTYIHSACISMCVLPSMCMCIHPYCLSLNKKAWVFLAIHIHYLNKVFTRRLFIKVLIILAFERVH